MPVKTVIVVAVVLIAACGDNLRPDAPLVQLVPWPGQEIEQAYVDGARAWEPLGFDIQLKDDGLVECARRWYATGDTDCQITIGVKRDPLLREREGTDALSNRADRYVVLDGELTDYFRVITAIAHEVGHILLDTPEHTRGGVMGGSSWVLEPVDYELACRSIGICIRGTGGAAAGVHSLLCILLGIAAAFAAAIAIRLGVRS
jgi:hypothetical protein